jgi:hypothetical protein
VIVRRCLRPSPARRYQTAAEVRSDLLDAAERAGWATSDRDLALWLRDLFGDRAPPWEELAAPVATPHAPRPRPRRRGITIGLSFSITMAVGLVVGHLAGLV